MLKKLRSSLRYYEESNISCMVWGLNPRSLEILQKGFNIFLFTFQVLELMKEVSEDKDDESESSDISGYHSDSESAVMTSGNSPFISKEARYSFLSRSGICICIFFCNCRSVCRRDIITDRYPVMPSKTKSLFGETIYKVDIYTFIISYFQVHP